MEDKYEIFRAGFAGRDSLDPHVIVGYAIPEYAWLRYDVVGRMLNRYENGIASIADVGAGTGTMWNWFLQHGILSKLKDRGLSKVVLAEPTEYFLPYLYEQASILREVGLDVSVIKADFRNPQTLDEPVDVVTSVSAVLFYDIFDLSECFRNFNNWSRLGYIVETNLQCPETSIVDGVMNSSLEVIYNMLYSMHLKNGISRVEAEFYKKWSVVFRIKK